MFFPGHTFVSGLCTLKAEKELLKTLKLSLKPRFIQSCQYCRQDEHKNQFYIATNATQEDFSINYWRIAEAF